MQQVSCPGCGAPVQFKSAASVLAVCEYCKTTLLKDANSVRDIGKMSEVLEDYSPLQIGTSGQYARRSFSLVGRIQLRYTEGFWNEWYVLFDDGSTGWLSDASGQYTMTFAREAAGDLPAFERLAPGQPLSMFGETYTTADIRSAQCTGGQGEHPVLIAGGRPARVADFRVGSHFLTLDYSEGDKPQIFLGAAVELADLKPQLLRDVSQITDAAGRFHGKVSALACPSCGASVPSAIGVTTHLICPNCHAEVDTSGATAIVLAAGASVGAQRFTLELGSTALIEGANYSVLGAMRRTEGDGSSAWNEYLLYAPGLDFVWLVETQEGWQRARVMSDWPRFDASGNVRTSGGAFRRDSDYVARVAYAAGSFNWRVSVGDTVRVTEYASGVNRLAAEMTREELTWSISRAVPLDQVRAWVGDHVHAEAVPHPSYVSSAKHVLIFLGIINAIPVLFGGGAAISYTLLAVLAILLPAIVLDRMDSKAP